MCATTWVLVMCAVESLAVSCKADRNSSFQVGTAFASTLKPDSRTLVPAARKADQCFFSSGAECCLPVHAMCPFLNADLVVL